MKYSRIVSLISLICVSIFVNANQIVTEKDGFKWQSYSQYGMNGAKDEHGKIIVPAKYKYVAYERGTFTVKNITGHVGKYSTTGDIIIPAYRYANIYEIANLSDGPFIVQSIHGWGLVSRRGKVLLKDVYNAMSVVGSGNDKTRYSLVLKKQGYCGIADLTGKIIITPDKYHLVFSALDENGVATFPFVIYGEGSGVCDKNGKEIIRTPYFTTVLTGVGKDKYYQIEDGNDVGKLDLEGKVIDPIDSRKDKLVNSSLLVGGRAFSGWISKDNKSFIKDDMGNIIIPPIYDQVLVLKNDFVAVQGRYLSLINTSGDVVIPIDSKSIEIYNQQTYFRTVDENNKQQIYGLDGKLLFPAIHKTVIMCLKKNIDVVDTLYVFSDYEKYGLKDKNGDLMIEPIWDDIGFLETQLGLYFYVFKDGKLGLCDINGYLFIQPEYTSITFSDKVDAPFFYVKSGSYYGVMDMSGRLIINSETFEHISFDNSTKLFTCTIGKRKCVFDYNGKLLSDNLSQVHRDEYINQADLAFEQEKYQEAAKLYGKAIDISPSSVIYFNRALSYYNIDQYNKAISDFKMALNHNPSDRVRDRAIDLIGKAEYYQEQKEIRRLQIVQAIFGVALTGINYAIQSQAGYTSTPTYNSNYSTQSSNSSSYDSYSNSSSNSSTSQQKQKCGFCGGKGSTIDYVANFGINEEPWCDECGKRVTSGHYHKKCTHCNGTGER